MNPANPGSGKPPPSFQTNVNRAKTKRWVEAKSYSYDGDEWGDDEYDEYDPSPPPPPPLPTARATGLRKPSQGGVTSPTSEPSSGRLPSSSRESPAQQDDTSRGRSPPVGSPTTLPPDTSSNDGQQSANSSKPLPFIRPADIYKRMEEERAKERPSADSSRPEDAVADKDPAPVSDLESDTQKQNQEGAEITAGSQLPEVQTGSNFGADILGQTSETQTAPTADSADTGKDDSERPDLHHNTSLGFRSVVHQAFDTPTSQQTLQSPNSTADTVVRSNSDGTSTISPIISPNLQTSATENRGPDETKTPTIEEDPGELGAEAEAAENQTPEFRPGHRRDFSTPSPGNSPARRPVVATNDHLVKPELADLSSISSSDSSAREDVETDVAEQEVTSTSPDGTSTPKPVITTNSPMEALRPLEMRGIVHHDHDPYAKTNDDLPTMSTDTSPQDTESDRLRKEIVRSLSPQPAFGREGTSPLEPRSRIRQESTLIPSEYDSYWNDSSFHETAGEAGEENAGIISASPADTTTKALPTAPDASTGTSQSQSALRRNFSWEDLGQADSPPQGDVKRGDISDAQTGGPTAGSEPTPQQDLRETERNNGSSSPDGDGKYSSKRDGLTVVPPHPEFQSPEFSNVGLAHPPQSAGSLGTHQDSASGSYPTTHPVKSVHSATDPRVPGFREILLLQTPNERIHMFNDAREQFAATDPGLENWLRITIQALPEHSELVDHQGHLLANTNSHRPTPSRNKFPKLPSSFANLSLQTSSGQDNSPQTSTPTHGRNPSVSGLGNVISGQQVQAKSKDFLHSAGVLGGKAGGAAKGLLAKSRSRFKGSGNDKVLLPPPVSGSFQTLPAASADTYPTQNGSIWPQRSYSLRKNLHLSSMSMGDTTASLRSIRPSLDASGDPTSVPVPRSNENDISARDFARDHVNEAQVTHPSNLEPEPITGTPEVSASGTSLPPSESIQNGHGRPTPMGSTSAAPPVLDIDIASPSIGERVFFAQPERTKADPSPKYQATEPDPKRGLSMVSTTYSTAISFANTHATGVSDSTDETLSIPDEKHAGNSPETHRNTRNSDLPSYQAFEPPAENTQLLRVENPPNHRRRFSFEDDDDDEPALENNYVDQQQHINNQMHSADTGQRDEKRGAGGYPASPSPPPPAPPYSEPSYPVLYTAPVASQHHEAFVQTPGQHMAYNQVNHGYNQYDNDPALHNPQGQFPSTYPGVNPQSNGYFPQHDVPPPRHYPYINTSVEQQSSSAPVFPPYRTNSWVTTRRQHQAGTYPPTEAVHSSYPTPGAAYPPRPQPHGGWATTPQIQPDTPGARSGYLEANRTPGGRNRSGSFTKLDSDSQKSAESTTVNAAVSRTDLSQHDKAGGVAGKDGVGKLKKRNKLQRASTSRDPTDSDNTKKKGFSRLSGIFGRSSTSASPRRAPFIPKLTSSSEQTEQHRLQSFNEPSGYPSLSTSTRAQTFAGDVPPIGGYYAPDSPLDELDDEIDEISALERSATSTGTNPGSYQPGQTSQGTSPTYRVSPINITRSNERQPRWDNNRSHTRNLHMRSRSPRAHPPRTQEFIDPEDDPNDPATNLGTFYSVVPATPRVGDQERPWNITLPNDGRRSVDQRPLSYIPQKLNNRARHQEHEQSQPSPVEESSVNPPAEDAPPLPPPKDSGHAPAPATHTRDAFRARGPSLVVVPPAGEHRDVAPARNVGGDCPVELPASGDTSDDEIVMSSTAYPGQEWQPSNLGHWD